MAIFLGDSAFKAGGEAVTNSKAIAEKAIQQNEEASYNSKYMELMNDSSNKKILASGVPTLNSKGINEFLDAYSNSPKARNYLVDKIGIEGLKDLTPADRVKLQIAQADLETAKAKTQKALADAEKAQAQSEGEKKKNAEGIAITKDNSERLYQAVIIAEKQKTPLSSVFAGYQQNENIKRYIAQNDYESAKSYLKGYEKERVDKKDKLDAITKIKSSFHEDIKALNDEKYVIGTLKSFFDRSDLKTDKELQAALIYKIARLLNGPGVLTDTDIKRAVPAGGWYDTAYRSFKQGVEGYQLVEEQIESARKLFGLLEANYERRVTDTKNDMVSMIKASDYDIKPEQVIRRSFLEIGNQKGTSLPLRNPVEGSAEPTKKKQASAEVSPATLAFFKSKGK